MIIDIVDGRPKGYITIDECAKKNSVSRELVYKRITENDLDCFYIDCGRRKCWYIKEDAFVNVKVPGYYGPRTVYFKEAYPFNMIRKMPDLCGCNPVLWEGTEKQLEGLEIAMNALPSREKDILIMRFQDKLHYDEIGEEWNLSRERVRQIIIRAVAKLSNPALAKYIVFGPDPDNATLKGRVSENFHYLDLSVRATKCLTRAKVNTIGDVIELFRNYDIIKIRNLGRKTLEEIETKITSYCGKSMDELLGEMI